MTTTEVRSRIVGPSAKFVWRIEGFSRLPRVYQRSLEESPVFSVGTDEFVIHLCPAGWGLIGDSPAQAAVNKEYVALFLKHPTGGEIKETNKVVCSFRMTAGAGAGGGEQAAAVVAEGPALETSTSWASARFAKIADVLAAAAANNDTVDLTAEVSVHAKTLHEPAEVRPEDGLRCLADDLKQLLDSPTADAALVVGDTSIPVHKTVLAARSPVFAAVFRSGFHEARRGEIVIEDAEPAVVRELVKFIYTGECAIFGPFAQRDDQHSQQHQQPGLGLESKSVSAGSAAAAASRLSRARALSGRIWAWFDPQQPRVQPAAAAATDAASAAAEPRPGLGSRILQGCSTVMGWFGWHGDDSPRVPLQYPPQRAFAASAEQPPPQQPPRVMIDMKDSREAKQEADASSSSFADDAARPMMPLDFTASLLLCADKYQVPSLVRACQAALAESLTLSNVCERLVFADRCGYQSLKAECVDFLWADSKRLAAVQGTEGFQLLDKQLLGELLVAGSTAGSKRKAAAAADGERAAKRARTSRSLQ